MSKNDESITKDYLSFSSHNEWISDKKNLLDNYIAIITAIFITIITKIALEHFLNLDPSTNHIFGPELYYTKYFFSMMILVLSTIMLVFCIYCIEKYKATIRKSNQYKEKCFRISSRIVTEILPEIQIINLEAKNRKNDDEFFVLKSIFKLNAFFIQIELMLGNENIVRKTEAAGFLPKGFLNTVLAFFKSTLEEIEKINEKDEKKYSIEIKNLGNRITNFEKFYT
jgi:uncharacterized membrane protein